MTSLWTVVGAGVLVFAATNVDDILLLAAFFSNRTLRPGAVVAGQFVGIGLLTAASGVAALLALSIPAGWIALLGLVPLGLGIRSLYALWQSQDKTEAEDALILDRESARRGVHSQWISVALVTIANGGDNLGVYIPLFSRDLPWFPIYAGVFAVMTGIWCTAGYWIVNHPVLGARIRQYGHRVFPWVLIALGLLILSDALVLVR